MNLDEAAALLAELSGQEVRPYATRDFGRDQNPAARSVAVSLDDSFEILGEIRPQLGPGILAFVGCTRSLAEGADPEGSEVVVACGDNQFDILRIAQTDAANFDMDTEDLVRKLQEYDAKFGIDIFHAETDTIQFRLLQLPDDMPAFCSDLYEFCPDIVDQGVESEEELGRIISESSVVYLWWD
ncbi:DUF4253 domain-containing protein [Blastopirellula sp. JC732]|uniref:DUF4253 domain-containing protein n=1 Tax=Blastopirellula sediminis TaxID=2894196 RepID=A0A9X1SFP9_9BACT|nr:DUF4253 domain-containing protein [Blastopirellula sediminis]MCC9607267.1 DUF4253 domain-containing protein [Blastopirellula sediminis]MCC9629440.1 DUF4253 domain-containing protein [Blastopirellula sediminis]